MRALLTLVALCVCVRAHGVPAHRGDRELDDRMFERMEERARPEWRQDEDQFQNMDSRLQHLDEAESARFRELSPKAPETGTMPLSELNADVTLDDPSLYDEGDMGADDGDDEAKLETARCARMATDHAKALSRDVVACKRNHECLVALKRADNKWIHAYNDQCDPMQLYDTQKCLSLHTSLKETSRKHMAACAGHAQCIVSALETKQNLDTYYQFQCGSISAEAADPVTGSGAVGLKQLQAIAKFNASNSTATDEDDDEPAAEPPVKLPTPSTPVAPTGASGGAAAPATADGSVQTVTEGSKTLTLAKILRPSKCSCCGQQDCDCQCTQQWVAPETREEEQSCACRPQCAPHTCMCPNTCACCTPQPKEWVEPLLRDAACPCAASSQEPCPCASK